METQLQQLLDGLKLEIETKRLILEPIVESHAIELVELLAHPDLHTFVPSDPPVLEKLKDQYRYWERRISPKGDELWLNWAAKSKESGRIIGHFQAGMTVFREASIAYTVGKSFQRRGFAYESLSAILSFLFEKLGAKSVKAWIDTRNEASVCLVKKLGMVQVELIKNADHFKGADSDEFVFEISRP